MTGSGKTPDRIMEAISKSSSPLTTVDIARILGLRYKKIKNALRGLRISGKVTQSGIKRTGRQGMPMKLYQLGHAAKLSKRVSGVSGIAKSERQKIMAFLMSLPTQRSMARMTQVCWAAKIGPNRARKRLTELKKRHRIKELQKNGKPYFRAILWKPNASTNKSRDKAPVSVVKPTAPAVPTYEQLLGDKYRGMAFVDPGDAPEDPLCQWTGLTKTCTCPLGNKATCCGRCDVKDCSEICDRIKAKRHSFRRTTIGNFFQKELPEHLKEKIRAVARRSGITTDEQLYDGLFIRIYVEQAEIMRDSNDLRDAAQIAVIDQIVDRLYRDAFKDGPATAGPGIDIFAMTKSVFTEKQVEIRVEKILDDSKSPWLHFKDFNPATDILRCENGIWMATRKIAGTTEWKKEIKCYSGEQSEASGFLRTTIDASFDALPSASLPAWYTYATKQETPK